MDGLIIVLDRSIIVALVCVYGAPLVERIWKVWIQMERLIEVFNRIVEITFASACQAPIVERFSEVATLFPARLDKRRASSEGLLRILTLTPLPVIVLCLVGKASRRTQER